MNMIMNHARVGEERLNLADELTERLCDTINDCLVAGKAEESLWTFSGSGEHWLSRYWDALLGDNLSIADTAQARVREMCAEVGLIAEISFDKRLDQVALRVRNIQRNLFDLDILSFTELILRCNLHPMQKVLLKAFYAGTVLNADLRLDQDDLRVVQHNPIPELYGTSPDTVKQLWDLGQNPFKEAHLRIGRRGGRTLLSAICAVYELYRLWCQESHANETIAVAYVHYNEARLLSEFLTKLEASFPFLKLHRPPQNDLSHCVPQMLSCCSRNGKAAIQFTIYGPYDHKIKTDHLAALIIDDAASSPIKASNCELPAMATKLVFDSGELQSLRFPTWIMNPSVDAKWLLAEHAKSAVGDFDMIFGAR